MRRLLSFSLDLLNPQVVFLKSQSGSLNGLSIFERQPVHIFIQNWTCFEPSCNLDPSGSPELFIKGLLRLFGLRNKHRYRRWHRQTSQKQSETWHETWHYWHILTSLTCYWHQRHLWGIRSIGHWSILGRSEFGDTAPILTVSVDIRGIRQAAARRTFASEARRNKEPQGDSGTLCQFFPSGSNETEIPLTNQTKSNQTQPNLT